MTPPADGWDRQEREALRDLGQRFDVLRERHRADPAIELLRAARAGVLPEELQEDVSRHLAESAWSRALLDGAASEEGVLDSEDEARLLARVQKGVTERPRRQSRQSWSRWMSRPAFAAAAACVILVAGLLAWRSRSSRTEDTRPPQPVVVVATAAPSATPAFHLKLEAPAVRLSVAVLTWRGAGQRNRLLTDLEPGLAAFKSGDYGTANAELSRLAGTYPDAFDVRYYQGVSRLFVNDVSGAIESLTAAERAADSSFAADASWYLGVAYERAGNIGEARKRLEALCKTAAPHSADACAALPQIK